MIIQANQAFEVRDSKLGVLSLKYGEIKSGVDDNWMQHSFFKGLVDDGLVVFYKDTKDTTAEAAQKDAKAKSIKADENAELNRLIDEAKNQAKIEAEQVIATHGYDKNKSERILKEYTEQAIKKAKELYEAKMNK